MMHIIFILYVRAPDQNLNQVPQNFMKAVSVDDVILKS